MITAEARGRLRLLRATLRGSADLTSAALNRVPADQVHRFLRCGQKGRARAAAQLRQLVPGVRWAAAARSLLIGAYLSPSEPIIVFPSTPGESQTAVVVKYAVIGLTCRGVEAASGLWTLELPDHALGRLIERTPRADVTQVIWQAHDAALSAAAIVNRHEELLLPAGPGAFVVNVVMGRDESANYQPICYIRARTWLHENQLWDDQRQRRLTPSSPAFADALLVPLALRP